MAQYANHPNVTAKDREELRHRLGLDQPMPVQYVKWLGLALRGDLGASFFSHQPVVLLIQQRLPLTLILMGTAEIFIIIFALILGLVSALKQYSFIDNLITSFSFIGYSMPIFFIALASIEIFAVQFKAWGWRGYLESQGSCCLSAPSCLTGFLPGGDPDCSLFPLSAF
jgi:peptide/nickel transport system permease protein